MEKFIKGKVFCLGDNIDTDQIIPAKHLVYKTNDPEERKLYGKFALSGLPVGNEYPFVEKNENKSVYSIIFAGKNFGCGSSREHAPLALKVLEFKLLLLKVTRGFFIETPLTVDFFLPWKQKSPF